MLTPTNSFLLLGGCYLCAPFDVNRSRNATVRGGQTDRRTQSLTETNWIYNLTHAICYSYGQIITVVQYRRIALSLLVGRQEEHRPVKYWVMRCWRSYLSGVRCRWFAYGPADATTTPSSLASLKSRQVEPFWCWLIQAVLEMRPLPLNRCLSVCQYRLRPNSLCSNVANCMFTLVVASVPW